MEGYSRSLEEQRQAILNQPGIRSQPNPYETKDDQNARNQAANDAARLADRIAAESSRPYYN